MRTVTTDAALHQAINDGEREVTAVPATGFELLRTFGLARDPIGGERRPEVVDLISVEASGADEYVAANAVVAGLWAGAPVWRRRRLSASMGERGLEGGATSSRRCRISSRQPCCQSDGSRFSARAAAI